MSVKNRIAQLEVAVQNQFAGQTCCCLVDSALTWEDEPPAQFAARMASGCANCGLPYLPTGGLLNVMADIFNQIYGATT